MLEINAFQVFASWAVVGARHTFLGALVEQIFWSMFGLGYHTSC